MRLIKTISSGQHTAKIYLDTDEYRVCYSKGRHPLKEECDSFEDTFKDAEGTANAELAFLNKETYPCLA